MITVNNGDVKVAGAKEELLADVSSIASFMYEYLTKNYKDKAQEKILLAIERGFLISEKMTQETAYEMQELTKKINGR